MRCRRAVLWASVELAASMAGAASAQSEHDVHFLSGHAAESGMDAHYAALPWPGAHLDHGVWHQSVDVSMASTRTEFIGLEGAMVAFGATKGTSRDRGYKLVNDVVWDAPLDLPNAAQFAAQLRLFTSLPTTACAPRCGLTLRPAG